MSVRPFALVGSAVAVALASCAQPATESPSAREEAASTSPAFAFYLPSQSHGRFSIARLDGAWMRCASGHWRPECPMDAVDFAPLGVSPEDASAMASPIGADPWSSPIVWVGAIERTRGAGRSTTLHVYETWRAATALPLVGEAFHVSHGAAQVVDLYDFTPVPNASLDLTSAPDDATCERVMGAEVCHGAQWFANAAAATQTGLIVVGDLGVDGVLRGGQFFRKVDVGQRHEADGAWVCSAAQTTCGDGDCELDPNDCVHRRGDGRGLIRPVHASAPVFVDWLRATGLIGPSEPLDLPVPVAP